MLAAVPGTNALETLKKHILRDRDPTVRPVANHSDVINIKFIPAFLHVNVRDVDKHTATVDIRAWHKYVSIQMFMSLKKIG